MDSLLSVSPSIVLPLSRHYHRRRLTSFSSFTWNRSIDRLRFPDQFCRQNQNIRCKLRGEDEQQGKNDRRDEELERAMRMDGTVPGNSDAFVKQVSSRAYDMRRHLQQSFDSSSYDVLEANPWRESSKSVYVLTHQENQLCTMKTRRNRSEVEKEPSLLFSKGGTRRNQSKQSQMGTKFFSSKMSNRCKALMRQIVCFSTENWSVDSLLAAWVKSANPERADWLSILKELERLNHPLYFEVFEHAFTKESFEPNIRDYTKIIHAYAKQNMLPEAENALTSMKNRGLICDQVTLTALVHMYSKAGNLKLAEDSFEEMKLLGVPLDRRSYGSIIMAYIRAEKLDLGERVLKEMEDQDMYAGREVYKALLRAYSMMGDSLGAQRVFDAIQLAGIIPDAKVCGLLINAYFVAGRNREAWVAFENMRKSGLEPNDKCVALVLSAYEKESRLNEALNLLVELERDGYVLGKECSELLLNWFRKIGVVDEVEVVLRDFVSKVPV